MNKFIDENLETGRIRVSQSQIASPFFFVKKKTADLRPVQNYIKVNDATVKDRYPLPLINELLDKVKDVKRFTKMDIRKGYYNIQIREGDEWKAAFKTEKIWSMNAWKVLGALHNPKNITSGSKSPLDKAKYRNNLLVYLDDILVFTKTLEEHREAIKEVLGILERNNLCIKPDKCEFEKDEVEFLGFIVGGGMVKMDPGKVKAIKEWKSPKNKKELQSFLGFANFY